MCQIAALKLGGRGWGEIFHDMQAKGLVTEKNLGQIVRDAERPGARAQRRPWPRPPPRPPPEPLPLPIPPCAVGPRRRRCRARWSRGRSHAAEGPRRAAHSPVPVAILVVGADSLQRSVKRPASAGFVFQAIVVLCVLLVEARWRRGAGYQSEDSPAWTTGSR